MIPASAVNRPVVAFQGNLASTKKPAASMMAGKPEAVRFGMNPMPHPGSSPQGLQELSTLLDNFKDLRPADIQMVDTPQVEMVRRQDGTHEIEHAQARIEVNGKQYLIERKASGHIELSSADSIQQKVPGKKIGPFQFSRQVSVPEHSLRGGGLSCYYNNHRNGEYVKDSFDMLGSNGAARAANAVLDSLSTGVFAEAHAEVDRRNAQEKSMQQAFASQFPEEPDSARQDAALHPTARAAKAWVRGGRATTAQSGPDLPQLNADVQSVEVGLRQVIVDQLSGDADKLPPHILQNIHERIGRSAKSGVLDTEHYATLAGKLEYADLRELLDIITSKALWSEFQGRFPSKEILNAKFGPLTALRNTLSHNRRMDDITLKEGEAAILWFQRQLGKSTAS